MLNVHILDSEDNPFNPLSHGNSHSCAGEEGLKHHLSATYNAVITSLQSQFRINSHLEVCNSHTEHRSFDIKV